MTENYTGADLTGASGDENRTLTLDNSILTKEKRFLITHSGSYLYLNTDYTIEHKTIGTIVTFLIKVYDTNPISASYDTDDKWSIYTTEETGSEITGANLTGVSGAKNRTYTLDNIRMTLSDRFLVTYAGHYLHPTLDYTVEHKKIGTIITFLIKTYNDIPISVTCDLTDVWKSYPEEVDTSEILQRFVDWMEANLTDPYEQRTGTTRSKFVFDSDLQKSVMYPIIQVDFNPIENNRIGGQNKTTYLEEINHNLVIYYQCQRNHKFEFADTTVLINEAQVIKYLQYIQKQIKANSDEFNCHKITFGTIAKPNFIKSSSVYVSMLPLKVTTYRR